MLMLDVAARNTAIPQVASDLHATYRCPIPVTSNPEIEMNRFAFRTLCGGGPATLASLQHTVSALRSKLTKVSDEVNHEFHEEGVLFHTLKGIVDKVNDHTLSLRTPNVVKVVATKTLPKDGAVTVDASRPASHQVISGGYIQGAENGEVTRAVQIQKPVPGYEVSVFEQPGLANGNQDAQVTAVAYGAPIAKRQAGESPKAVVFGTELLSQ